MKISNELKKGIIFCLTATIFFSFMGISFNFYGHSSDDETHKKMGLDPNYEKDYAPLLRSFSWLFAHDYKLWTTFIMILFAFITPLILIKITNSWWAGLFYFATTNYFYWTIQGGYAQGLLVIFILGLLATKNNLLRIIIFCLGLSSHSMGFIAMPITFLLILLNENYALIKEHFTKFKYQIMLGGCSAFWGRNPPQETNFNLSPITLTGNLKSYWGAWITPNSILTLLGKIAPIFFLIPAIQALLTKKRFDLIMIIIGGLILSIEYGTRTWYIIPIPMIIGFTWFLKELQFKKKNIKAAGWQITINEKKIWILLVIGYLIFQLAMYVNFNLNC